jgi:hypothetical protein
MPILTTQEMLDDVNPPIMVWVTKDGWWNRLKSVLAELFHTTWGRQLIPAPTLEEAIKPEHDGSWLFGYIYSQVVASFIQEEEKLLLYGDPSANKPVGLIRIDEWDADVEVHAMTEEERKRYNADISGLSDR